MLTEVERDALTSGRRFTKTYGSKTFDPAFCAFPTQRQPLALQNKIILMLNSKLNTNTDSLKKKLNEFEKGFQDCVKKWEWSSATH